MTFVDDWTQSRQYGDQLIAEIRTGIQPSGECASCRRQLGTGPLRLDDRFDDPLDDGERVAVFTARHAACQPLLDVPGATPIAHPSYRAITIALPMEAGEDRRSRRRLFGRRARQAGLRGQVTSVPTAVINPSISGAFLVRGNGRWQPPMERLLLSHGYATFGQVRIAHDEPLPPMTTLSMSFNHTLTVNLCGTAYEVTGSATLRELVTLSGGVLLVITRRHWIDEHWTAADIKALVTDPAGAAVAWVAEQHIDGLSTSDRGGDQR